MIYDMKNKIVSELAGFRFWQLKLTAQPANCSKWFLKLQVRLVTVCWITGVKFNRIQSILVWLLHITQFIVCATKNLTVFVADSPRCLKWSSMVAAISRALRELSEPCLRWMREPRGQTKSLGARWQYSQAMVNNVLPLMTDSPAFLASTC